MKINLIYLLFLKNLTKKIRINFKVLNTILELFKEYINFTKIIVQCFELFVDQN